MRGSTNAAKRTLPKNGTYYALVVFGANAYDGYYRSFIPMPNADEVSVSLIGMGVIGQSWWSGETLASKTQIFTDQYGIYLNCNDPSVIGNTCNPQLTVGGGIKALLGKARALLQEVLSHAGKYQCDKQGTAIHRLTYFERKMDTQRGRRAGNDRWIIGHRQWGSIDHGMHRASHKITGRECKLPNIRPIRLGHMPRLCYGGRDPEIQLAGHNDRIWDGNVQYRMTKGLVA